MSSQKPERQLTSDKPELSGICKRCHQLNGIHHKVLQEMIDELLELDKEESEVFSQLLGEQGYGSISLIFRAGSCVGLDWQSSHRTHEV